MQQVIPPIVFQYLKTYREHEGFCFLQQKDKSFLFLEPVLKVWADYKSSHYQSATQSGSFNDSWQALEFLIRSMGSKENANDFPAAAGYFSYELSRTIERLSNIGNSEEEVPLYLFYLYRSVMQIKDSQIKTCVTKLHQPYDPFWTASATLPAYEPVSPDLTSCSVDVVEDYFSRYSNFTKDSYIKAVEQIIELIKDGKVYQVNLSQKFSLQIDRDACGALAENFLNMEQAAFSAYFHCSFKDQKNILSIISASPELFLNYDNERLLTSPIKGTKLKEGQHDSERDMLSASRKDLAELAMIVDIERNDLGKIAVPGSVQVERHARLESLSHVHHMLSDISCKLSPATTFLDIIKAVFPSGSISGAPKIAAMNFIADFENSPRGAYTGSIGSISPDGSFNFNVAIRTASILNDKVTYSAGGGIVIDSVPEEEYRETLAKTMGFYLALQFAKLAKC